MSVKPGFKQGSASVIGPDWRRRASQRPRPEASERERERSTDLCLASQHYLERLVFAVAQEAVCVEAVVAAVEPEEHRVVRGLGAVERVGDEADLRGGSSQVEGAGGGQGLVEMLGRGWGVRVIHWYQCLQSDVFC